MPYKHQSNCYRNIKGVKYINYSDLLYADETENDEVVARAKTEYKLVKVIKHHSGEYKQVFVSNGEPADTVHDRVLRAIKPHFPNIKINGKSPYEK